MSNDRPRQHAWRTAAGARPASIEPGKSSRGAGKRYVVLAIALMIAGVIAGFLFWPTGEVRPIFLGVVINQYENKTFPPNPWAQADGEALRACFKDDSALAAQAQERSGILDQISTLADRTSQAKDKNRPVVIYLNAFAAVRDGKVCVLPGRADPDNASLWLPLEQILDAMRRGSGSRLLLLDLCQPIADAHSGIVANNVSDVLNDQLQHAVDVGELEFMVLASCGKGQVSHVSLELQRSVFGFFLQQGLVGNADGWNDRERANGQVTAMELVKYTIAHVADWADQNHLSPQVPQLFGKGKDFLLITPGPSISAPGLPEPYGDYPKLLVDGWAERDNWIKDGSSRRLPRTFRELEVILLRAERRWLAGDAEDKIKLEFAGKYEDLKAQKLANAPKTFAARSIAEARRTPGKDDRAIVDKVHSILLRTPLKPDDLKPLIEKPPEPPPYAAISHGVMETLIEPADLPTELLKNADQLLKNLTPSPRLIELESVKLLLGVDQLTQQRWGDLPGVRGLILSSARDAELASAVDPRVLPWIKSELAAGDAARREGLFKLITLGMEERKQGADQLRDALKHYEVAQKTAQALERAMLRLEEARALIPDLVAPLGDRVPDSTDEQLWASLIASTGKVQQMLSSKDDRQLDLGGLAAETDRLQSVLARVRRPYESSELKRLLRRASEPNGPTPDQLRRLLDSPIWSGPDRASIYTTAREQGKSTSAAAIAHANGLLPGANLPPADQRFADAPAWRAKLAINLLSLDGITPTAELEQALERAKKSNKPDDWHDLGRRIRKAWAVALPEKYRDSLNLADRDRVGIIIHPLDIDAVGEPDQRFPGEPAIELRKKQAQEFWQWLARERYFKDADKFLGVKDLDAYGKALKDVGMDLQSR